MRTLSLILALCLPAFAADPEPETRDLWIYTDVDEDSGEAQVYASESPHVFQTQDLRIEGQRKHMSLRRKARHEVMLENRSGRYQHAIWKVAELEGSLAVALHGLRVELEAVFAGEELVVENLPGVAPVSVSGELFYGGSPVYAHEGHERRSARLVVDEVDWAVHGWSEQLSNSVGLGAAQADSAVEITLRGWKLKHEQVFVFDELLARAQSGPLASSSGDSSGSSSGSSSGGSSSEGSDDAGGLVWVKEQRTLGGADPDGFGVSTSSAGSATGLLARPANASQSAAGSNSTGSANSKGASGSSTAGATSNPALTPSASPASTPVTPGDLAFTTPGGAPLALPGGAPGSASAVSAGPGTTVAAGGVSSVGSSGGTPVSGVTAGTSTIVPPSLGSGGVSGSATGSSVTTTPPVTPPTVGIVGALGR